MILPAKGFIIAQSSTKVVGGFEVVGASQTLLSGKVLSTNLVNEEGIAKPEVNDVVVFDITESYKYTFDKLGETFLIPEEAIKAFENDEVERNGIL